MKITKALLEELGKELCEGEKDKAIRLFENSLDITLFLNPCQSPPSNTWRSIK